MDKLTIPPIFYESLRGYPTAEKSKAARRIRKGKTERVAVSPNWSAMALDTETPRPPAPIAIPMKRPEIRPILLGIST